MDFDGTAVLEWAPHGSLTITGSVRVQISATRGGWEAHALAPTFDDWWFLLGFAPPYRLVFPDGSTFDVGVDRPDANGRFRLWDCKEAESDARRTLCPDCSGDWDVSVTDNGDGSMTVLDRCTGCRRELLQHYRWQAPEGT